MGTSLFFLPKPSLALLSSSLPFFRHQSEVRNGCKKISEAHICRSRSPFIVSESNLSAALPCSLGPNPQLQTGASNGLRYGDLDHKVRGIPMLPRRRRLVGHRNAYKDDFFAFKIPALTEKPEWWWRTLACVPYLIALQISYTGYLLQPLLEHYHRFGDLIFFVPGAITRLPAWFTMVYSYFVYVGVVKNKDWPHFFRFHVMMGLLLDIALQVLWTASNFFPLIHYEGKFGMYYWAGTGLAFILVLLQCVKSALAGCYADIPFVSNTAFIHTLFNFGG